MGGVEEQHSLLGVREGFLGGGVESQYRGWRQKQKVGTQQKEWRLFVPQEHEATEMVQVATGF